MVGRIERVALREIWRHEAYDFTTWLSQNIEALNEVIDFEILNVETEKSTGTFSVDIIGEDSAGNMIIIENQLEKSDHDHLGKLITYLAAFDAKVAIWIVATARQEHIQAVSWLNENKESSFYLIQVEGIKIGDSLPAPLFTTIVEPSEELKRISSVKQENTERHKLRRDFWSLLLNEFKTKDSLFQNISPSQYNWIGTSSGLRGVGYTFWLKKNSVSIKLYIDRGKGSGEDNVSIFNQLYENRAEIESGLNYNINWLSLEKYRACVIDCDIESGGWQTDKDDWHIVIEECIEKMIQFKSVLQPYINKIKI